MEVAANHFELFGIEPSFNVDLDELTQRYRALQKKLHPDNFAHTSDGEKRLSMQYTSMINEAYSVLKSDFPRAAYLLSLAQEGAQASADETTVSNPAFLMEQMLLREKLEAIPAASEPFASLDQLEKEILASIADKKAVFVHDFETGKLDAARSVLLEWQFLDKLQHDLERVEETLD